MNNNYTDNFINYNPNYTGNKPTENPYPVENINAVETPENNFNSNSNYNAPVPVMNPQNSNQYLFNAPPQGYYAPNFIPNSYPSSPYPPQGYPYNQNAVNQIQSNNELTVNPLIYQRPNGCIKNMLLVMSIIMFLFLIAEITIFNSLGIYFDNVFVIVDEIGILVCAILFLISFITKERNVINPIMRSVITGIVWFVGFGLRGFGNIMSDNTFNEGGIKFGFLGLRSFILFFSIPVSTINGAIVRQN